MYFCILFSRPHWYSTRHHSGWRSSHSSGRMVDGPINQNSKIFHKKKTIIKTIIKFSYRLIKVIIMCVQDFQGREKTLHPCPPLLGGYQIHQIRRTHVGRSHGCRSHSRVRSKTRKQERHPWLPERKASNSCIFIGPSQAQKVIAKAHN